MPPLQNGDMSPRQFFLTGANTSSRCKGSAEFVRVLKRSSKGITVAADPLKNMCADSSNMSFTELSRKPGKQPPYTCRKCHVFPTETVKFQSLSHPNPMLKITLSNFKEKRHVPFFGGASCMKFSFPAHSSLRTKQPGIIAFIDCRRNWWSLIQLSQLQILRIWLGRKKNQGI